MSMRSNQTLSLLAAGAAVGVVAGMLMAPYSGHESRSVTSQARVVAGMLMAPYSGHESRSVVKRNIARIYGSARSKSRITGFRRSDTPNPSMAVNGPYPHS